MTAQTTKEKPLFFRRLSQKTPRGTIGQTSVFVQDIKSSPRSLSTKKMPPLWAAFRFS
jgi:hypothetical protein